MNKSMLDYFLDEEGGFEIWVELKETIDEIRSDSPLVRKVFEFNIFDVTINGETNKVLIEDILCNFNPDEIEISLDEFEEALKNRISTGERTNRKCGWERFC